MKRNILFWCAFFVLGLSVFTVFAQLPKDNPLNVRLQNAASEGDAELCQDLINAGADVNCYVESSNSPLIRAAQAGKVEVIRVLLNAGAEVNAQGNDGSTPLHYAILGWNTKKIPEVLKLLLEAGADVDLKDNTGYSPLQRALTMSWAGKLSAKEDQRFSKEIRDLLKQYSKGGRK